MAALRSCGCTSEAVRHSTCSRSSKARETGRDKKTRRKEFPFARHHVHFLYSQGSPHVAASHTSRARSIEYNFKTKKMGIEILANPRSCVAARACRRVRYEGESVDESGGRKKEGTAEEREQKQRDTSVGVLSRLIPSVGRPVVRSILSAGVLKGGRTGKVPRRAPSWKR